MIECEPCDCTQVTIDLIPTLDIFIGGTATTQLLKVGDSASYAYGNYDGFTFCGGRTYTVISGAEDWLTIDPSTSFMIL